MNTQGELNGNARLTEADVREIRRLYVPGSGRWGINGLAGDFQVDPSAIYLIVKRKRWGHVQ